MVIIGIAGREAVVSDSGRDSRRLSAGEFERFYAAHAAKLLNYLRRVSGDATLADDIFQQAFCRFLEVDLRTHEEHALRGLLYTIATNLLHDHWRREKREAGPSFPPPSVSDAASDVINRRDVDAALATLSRSDRALLWLAHVEERSHREIAEALRVKEKSVRVLLFRARRKMAAAIEALGARKGAVR